MCRNHCFRVLMLASLVSAVGGCSTTAENNQLTAATAGILGIAPTSNIGQTYYLGVFDPREQLPPTLYRIRVQGQSNALSRTEFASGWVRADLVDSLSGRVDLNNGKVALTEDATNKVNLVDNQNGLNRRLVMFGPEGFREAPKNHRLVVVMGSDPSSFFSAVDQALGVVAGVTQTSTAGADVSRAIWPDLSRMREERRAMQQLLDLTAAE